MRSPRSRRAALYAALGRGRHDPSTTASSRRRLSHAAARHQTTEYSNSPLRTFLIALSAGHCRGFGGARRARRTPVGAVCALAWYLAAAVFALAAARFRRRSAPPIIRRGARSRGRRRRDRCSSPRRGCRTARGRRKDHRLARARNSADSAALERSGAALLSRQGLVGCAGREGRRRAPAAALHPRLNSGTRRDRAGDRAGDPRRP